MRLLLDTHIVIWWTYVPHRLAPKARYLLNEAERLVSVASIWEAAIKFGAGKLPEVREGFSADLLAAGCAILPVTDDCAWEVRKLPRGKHLDPFDRLILSQAKLEGVPLVTRDKHLAAYDVLTVGA